MFNPEYESLNFDSRYYDGQEWWRQQDEELEREELERIESRAELEQLRHEGYGE